MVPSQPVEAMATPYPPKANGSHPAEKCIHYIPPCTVFTELLMSKNPQKSPTFIKVGSTTVVDRAGRSRTREEYVRDVEGLVFPGLEMRR